MEKTSRYRRLTVIGEVFINDNGVWTKDRSFNEILKEYAVHFDAIHYIGPGSNEYRNLQVPESNVYFSSYNKYSKTFTGRLRGWFTYMYLQSFVTQTVVAFRTDLVQIRIPAFFPLMSTAAIRKMRLPYLCYIAGDWKESLVQSMTFPGSKALAALLSAWEFRCIKMAKVLITAGVKLSQKYPNKPVIIYRSTTHRKIHRRERSAPPSRLLYVGRLEAQKRVEDALVALASLLKKGLDMHLTIVGAGKLEQKLKQLGAELEIEHAVTWRGLVSDTQELHRLYYDSDLLLLPSLAEGTPKVLPEAMSYGLIPIACREVGSIDSIISDGENGILVSKRSPDEIALKCEELYRDPVQCARMREGAYDYATEHTLPAEISKCWKGVFKILSDG